MPREGGEGEARSTRIAKQKGKKRRDALPALGRIEPPVKRNGRKLKTILQEGGEEKKRRKEKRASSGKPSAEERKGEAALVRSRRVRRKIRKFWQKQSVDRHRGKERKGGGECCTAPSLVAEWGEKSMQRQDPTCRHT